MGNKLKYCIYSKNSFTIADGEHILQNFLGARWTSNEIVSNKIQEEFGKTIDVALESGLQPIRNLLGTKGGRRGSGPTLKNIKTTKGQKLSLQPGGVPVLSEPTVRAKKTSEDTGEAQIILGCKEQLGWALKKLKDKFPTAKFNVDKIKEILKPQQGNLDGRVHLKMGIGGIDFFRGLLKSCFNLLGVANYSIALSDEFNSVRDFIFRGEGNCSEFIRWANDSHPIQIPSIGDFDHFICIYSEKNSVFGVAQLFGEISYFIRLSSNYTGVSFQNSYLVDPTRKADPPEIRNVLFDSSVLPEFEIQHKDPGAYARSVFSEKMSRLMSKWSSKTYSDMISNIVDEILLPYDGEPLTEELISELSHKVSEYIARRVAQCTQQLN